jgi:hypothetical protein
MRQTPETPAIDETGVPGRVSDVLRRALSYAPEGRQAAVLTLAREPREALGG